MTFFLPFIFWALKTLTWQPGLCGCFLQLIRKTEPRNMHAWSVCYNNMNMTLLHIIWPSKCDQNSLYVYYIWHTGARLKHLNFRNYINQRGGRGGGRSMCVSLAYFVTHQASGQIDGQTGNARGNSLRRSVAWKMSEWVVNFFLKAYQL